MDENTNGYESQLHSVELALQATTTSEERSALEDLKRDLLELIELTKQTTNVTQLESNEMSIDDELERFKNEIAQLDTNESNDLQAINSNTKDDTKLRLQELKESLEEMVGQRCSAPHKHCWGSVAYHNAIVCGVEDIIDTNHDTGLSTRLRVLFTNPTHREMLPCSYYLEGECRFDDAHCHYSHGELVAADELHSFIDPDFTRLARNCVVLAKLPDRLWHRGRVLCANFVEKICRVRLDRKDQKQRDLDFPFENLLPIFQDDDLSSGSSSNSSNEEDSDGVDDLEIAERTLMSEKNIFDFQPTQPLGEWEKHTRGIGSKLMAKMGYIYGTGLGSDGRGIITPVTAQILPPGCSLDHCMKLREAANGNENFFSIEKKLRREQKKQELVNAKAYAREEHRADVFSFLNDNVLSNPVQASNVLAPNCDKRKTSLNQQTTKSLNVASVRIADDIRRKEREMLEMKKSLDRNASSTDINKRLQQQLLLKTQELDALKKEQKCLSKEQTSRKNKNQLCVF